MAPRRSETQRRGRAAYSISKEVVESCILSHGNV